MQTLIYAQKWLGQKWQVAQPCSGQSQSDRSPISPTYKGAGPGAYQLRDSPQVAWPAARGTQAYNIPNFFL